MKYKKFFCIIPLLFLVGCGMSEVTDNDMRISATMEKSREECYKSRKIDLSKVPEEQVALVAQGKIFSDALLAVTGVDPCATTNVYDAKIAEVTSKNKAVSTGIGVAGSVVKYGVVAVGAVELGKTMGSEYTANDNAKISTTNENFSRNTTSTTDESFNASAGDDGSPVGGSSSPSFTTVDSSSRVEGADGTDGLEVIE